ncbi:FMN-binding negative transcriptional regulator [Jatrophihabitans fulvus]
MYTPAFNRVDDEDALRDFVRQVGSAWLVTADGNGLPQATLLPIVWRGDTVVAHLAVANDHWRAIGDGRPALLIVGGDETYVSPSWYASKVEHGRVVPTWNYSAVQLTGTARVHRDERWLRAAVTELTEAHESSRDRPWQVTDAPEAYVSGQLRGIVGVEVTVTGVEGKAKLSQNRSAADRRGVIEGLRTEPARGADGVARAMSAGVTDGAMSAGVTDGAMSAGVTDG